MAPSIMIVASGGSSVGWGHVMRCCSIAEALRKQSCDVIFGSLNDEIAALTASLGFKSIALDVDSLSSREDADRVKRIALQHARQVILIDSYDVCQAFFQALQSDQYRVAYIDDLFLYKVGFLDSPKPYPVDVLINYGFEARKDSYALTYLSSDVRLLVGPSYAPVRPIFVSIGYTLRRKVQRVLLTSGSTNPNHALEKMVFGCKNLGDDVTIDVIIGRNASFDIDRDALKQCVIHEGVNDLSSLMQQADIVVSSAGSTLYELACVGVPTIALPVVENQLSNARGFLGRKLGYGSQNMNWDAAQVFSMLCSMMGDYEARMVFSKRMQRAVDGLGALRIAEALIQSS